MRRAELNSALSLVSRVFILYIFVNSVLALMNVEVTLGAEYGTSSREAVVVNINMNIDGGTVSYIERVLGEYRGKVLVLKINSHGGYLSAADRIVSAIVESGVECYSWIPPGGYAVSAATMVALACNRVYMGPGSVIGGVKPIPWDPKVAEYIKGRLRGLLERQGKFNASYVVEDMVDEARTFTAEEAQRIGLALVASELDELATVENFRIARMEYPNAWERLLSLLSNQVIAQFVLFIGVLLILMEVFTTGFQGYAVAGAVLIVLGLYSLALVPVDIVYLILVVAGAVLLAIELYTPGFGLFGISGIILATTGFVLAITTQPPEVMTPPVYALIGGFIALGGFVVFIALSAAKASRIKRKPITEQLVGSIGLVKTDVDENQPGVVYVSGEDWTAYSIKGHIPSGRRVRVIRVEGLKLYVEPIEEA